MKYNKQEIKMLQSMFKYSSIIGLLVIAASCAQNKEPATSKSTPGDSNRAPAQSDIGTTPTNSIMPKHDAYKSGIESLPTSLSKFIPEGYTALDTMSGNLNLDDYTDMIMVLKKDGEDTTSEVVEHPEKRPLLILVGQSDNTYKLAAKNDNVVYCIDCGGMMGDPFMNVVIKNGYFSIEHYGGSSWRWTRTITFKYSPSDNYWYLHKDGGDSFNTNDPEKVTTAVKTAKDFGKVRFDAFDIYKEE